MTTALIISTSISALWILVQTAWMHWQPLENRFGAMLTGFLASLPVLLLTLILEPVKEAHAQYSSEPYALVIFHAALFHILVFLCYVECFYHVERSVTFRMLIEIASRPEGIPLSNLREEYNLHEMVGRRMEVLRKKDFVVQRQGRWQLTSKGRLLARAMHITLWVFQAKSQRDR